MHSVAMSVLASAGRRSAMLSDALDTQVDQIGQNLTLEPIAADGRLVDRRATSFLAPCTASAEHSKKRPAPGAGPGDSDQQVDDHAAEADVAAEPAALLAALDRLGYRGVGQRAHGVGSGSGVSLHCANQRRRQLPR